MEELSSIDIQELAEGHELEVKSALGKDGKGELPRSFFESYSAMANTDGGVILLGISEKPPGTFLVSGIVNTAKVLKSLWDGLNDRHQVSVNLLTDAMVTVVELQGQPVIRISVPRAKRQQRPVHLGLNPLTGTFRRSYEGDYRCDAETVRRMLAEQVEDVRDARLLDGFTFADLDEDSFRTYRNHFRATKPDHPWAALDDQEFLRCIGGWTRDRQTGQDGLTLAGLLMFGKLRSILDAVPHYILDYQEHLHDRPGTRWADRLTTDGAWSGNLYDFYRRTFQKLTQELKVPFRLQGTTRIDETPIHEALREALVNVLIHADYTGRVPILVIKRSDLFGFRNPGMMRLTLIDALGGGLSDCRNRNLQKMFQLVGLGEQAGSGIPKIYRNWQEQHWRVPILSDIAEPEQTLLALRMVSLLPEQTLNHLDARFGAAFRELSEVERLALATVAIEGEVTHARLRSMTSEHPHDLSKLLSNLVKQGFLESAGVARGTYYFFPGDPPSRHSLLSGADFVLAAGLPPIEDGEVTTTTSIDSQHPVSSSQHVATSSQHLEEDSQHQDELATIAAPVRLQRNVPKQTMEQTIEALCALQFLTVRELATLLGRAASTLQVHYLSNLVHTGRLHLRYPERPNHPKQAYGAGKVNQVETSGRDSLLEA